MIYIASHLIVQGGNSTLQTDYFFLVFLVHLLQFMSDLYTGLQNLRYRKRKQLSGLTWLPDNKKIEIVFSVLLSEKQPKLLDSHLGRY